MPEKYPLEIVTVSVTETASNTYTSQQFDLPENIYSNEITIIEVEKIGYSFSGIDTAPTATDQFTAELTPVQYSSLQGWDSDRVIWSKTCLLLFATSGLVKHEYPQFDEITPKYPVARDRLFLAVKGVGQAGAVTATIKLYFRRKRATKNQFIALFKSQAG